MTIQDTRPETGGALSFWDLSAAGLAPAATVQDQLRHVLNYAVLAPSVYNTQPWRFRLGRGAVDLLADRSRVLPVADPTGRQLVMSCGAALFYLTLAIRHLGYQAAIQTHPAPADADWLARVAPGVGQAATPDEEVLFRAMPYRHTERQPFDGRRVALRLLRDLEQTAPAHGVWVQSVEAPARRSLLADLVAAGDETLWADPAFRQELAGWLYAAPAAPEEGMRASGAFAPFLVRAFDLGDSQAQADREEVAAAPALLVLGTDADDAAHWLAAGQALAHLLLAAAAEGLAASFLNSPLLVPTLRSQVQDVLAHPGYPQMILRVGYGTATSPVVRRPAVLG